MNSELQLKVCRNYLALAKQVLRRAERMMPGPGRAHELGRSRWLARCARAHYRLAVANGPVTHHYIPAPEPCRWLAEARIGDTVAWRSARTYGRRQSAQRAAWAWVAHRV